MKCRIVVRPIGILAFFVAMCLLLPLFSGCAIVTALRLDADPNALLTPNASPLPTPRPNNEYNDELYAVFCENFYDELFMINAWSLKYGYDFAQTMQLNIPRYTLKAGLLRTAIDDAVEAVYEYAREQFPNISRSYSIEYPSFQFLATVLPFARDGETFLSFLDISFDILSDAQLIVNISQRDVAQLAHELSGGDSEVFIDIRFTYAYLTAIFNGDGEEDVALEYDFPQEIAQTLVFPLISREYTFRDTWCDTRSNNTRKHMGTDIKAAEGTEILSCSDGTVTATGYGDIPGNFVIVTDSFGFEYHYYHLVVPTEHVRVGDAVSAGDVIGNVGCTGNSDADHLHISIIDDSGKFVNPYSLMEYLKSR